MEMTTTERRVRVLETRLNEALARLAAAEMALGKALQDAGNAGMAPGGGGGGSSSTRLCYTQSLVGPRSGNVPGRGAVDLLAIGGGSTSMAETGVAGETAVTAYNVTGSSGPINAYGLVTQVGGLYYFLVLDCFSTVNPAAPAAAPIAAP